MRYLRFGFSILITLVINSTAASGSSLASVRAKAQQAKHAHNLRQVAIATNVYSYSGDWAPQKTDKLESMESLLRAFVSIELFEASIFLNKYDLEHIDADPPRAIGYKSDSGEFVFQPDILSFPIAFSFAVYSDENLKGPMTPLLWTRGLHKYEEFDQPYGGHVAFLDGHVMYYEGTPGEPNPELTELFGPESEFSKTVLILEHEPQNWAVEKLAPLPVRYAKATAVKYSDLLGILAIVFGPATIAAMLVGILPKPTTRQRLRSASIAFGVVLIATLLLTSTVC